MRDLRPQVLACTPSYALSTADKLDEAGLGPGDLKLGRVDGMPPKPLRIAYPGRPLPPEVVDPDTSAPLPVGQ